MARDNEDAYFKKQELARLRQERTATAKAMETQEKQRLKQQHWMRCPKCGMELAEVDFRGVKVDACFDCGGMYFDAGEVDKVLAREEPGLLQSMVNSLFDRGA